jgi:hypothetical protein
MSEALSPPTLRPLSVADLVDEIFRLYRRNFGLLLALAALPFLPAIILLTVGLVLVGDIVPKSSGETITFTPAAATGLLTLALSGLAFLIAFPILTGGLTDATAQRYLGRPTTVKSSLQTGVRFFWRILGGALLLGLTVLFVFVVPIGVIVGVSLVGGGGALWALLLLAVPLAVTLAIWLYITWAFWTQAIILEGTGILAGLRRSAQLVSGSRWRVIGIYLLLQVIQVVLVAIPSTFASALQATLPPNVGLALSNLISTVFTLLLYPISLGTFTLLYFDLRVRKEGLDLTLAAERLSAG